MNTQAILLDIDGTLLNSNEAHAASWSDALAEFGFDIPCQQITPLIGMGGDKLLRALIGLGTEEGTGKELDERQRAIFLERYVHELKPTTGARALVEKLRSLNLQVVIATSANSDELEALLDAANVTDLIDKQTGSSDVEESKPEPDIVHAALEKAKTAPEAALMLGDTPYDIEAAAKARVGTIAFRSGGHGDEDLSGALAIYDDPADLLRHFDMSPIVRDPDA